MNYTISEQKLLNAINSYMQGIGMTNVEEYSNTNWGGLSYYPIEWHETDDEGDYESAPWFFSYYKDTNDYGYEETYEPEEFPIVVINYELYEKIIRVFTEEIFKKYGSIWFEKFLSKPVKSVDSE